MKSYTQIIEDLQTRKKNHEQNLNALEAVKFKTKKDGTPFKNVNLNLENATVYQEWKDYKLRCRNPKTYDYIDYIQLWDYEQNDTLTIDEKVSIIKKAINEYIEREQKYIQEYIQKINDLANVYDDILEKLKDLQSKYDEWYYLLDLSDCNVKYNDYSDGRIKKAQEDEHKERVINAIKEACHGLGTRERKILDNATKIETFYNRQESTLNVLYTIYDADNNTIQIQKDFSASKIHEKPTYTIVG